MKTKGKSKKAFAAFLLSCVLLIAIAPNVGAAPKWWETVMKTLGFDTGLSCYHQYQPDGCHRFIFCADCSIREGIPEGPADKCL